MIKKPAEKKPKYCLGIGRRKTAQAKVKLFLEGEGRFTVNQRELGKYFPTLSLQKITADPLEVAALSEKVNVVAQAQGGGVVAQAQAISLGLSRALVKADANLKTVLKKHRLLTRDARKKERKKPGLKRARRAPQWQKR